MSDLTVAYDPKVSPGVEIRLAMAAVAVIYGGAIGIVRGTGYATPLRTATAGMLFVGVAEEQIDNSTGAAGDKYVRIRRQGICCFNQGTLVQSAVGKKAYFSDDNTITLTASGNIYAGVITHIDQERGLAWVDITDATRAVGTTSSVQIAAGTALTNSTTETSLGSYSIPANRLKAGDRIRVRAQGTPTSGNSTNTLTIKLYIGGLSGTAVVTTAAFDVTDGGGDVFYVDCEIVIRTDGASGTLVACGVQAIGVPGTVTAKPFFLGSTAVDTTAAQVIAVSGTWSAASASDSCRLDILNVDVIPS